MTRFTHLCMTACFVAAMATSAHAARMAKTVGPEEFLTQSKQKGAVILDLRDATDPKTMLMDNAIAMPSLELSKEKVEPVAPDHAAPLLVFCNASIMSKSEAMATRRVPATKEAPGQLLGYGYQRVYVLQDASVTLPGFAALPLHPAAKEQK